VSTGLGFGMLKGKVAPRIVLSDTKVSSTEDDAPLQRRMRWLHSDGSAVSGPLLSGQSALEVAATSRPDLRAMASIVPNGSDGNGSTSTAREASVAAEKATKARMKE
jgi:hypothetical protein